MYSNWQYPNPTITPNDDQISEQEPRPDPLQDVQIDTGNIHPDLLNFNPDDYAFLRSNPDANGLWIDEHGQVQETVPMDPWEGMEEYFADLANQPSTEANIVHLSQPSPANAPASEPSPTQSYGGTMNQENLVDVFGIRAHEATLQQQTEQNEGLAFFRVPNFADTRTGPPPFHTDARHNTSLNTPKTADTTVKKQKQQDISNGSGSNQNDTIIIDTEDDINEGHGSSEHTQQTFRTHASSTLRRIYSTPGIPDAFDPNTFNGRLSGYRTLAHENPSKTPGGEAARRCIGCGSLFARSDCSPTECGKVIPRKNSEAARRCIGCGGLFARTDCSPTVCRKVIPGEKLQSRARADSGNESSEEQTAGVQDAHTPDYASDSDTAHSSPTVSHSSPSVSSRTIGCSPSPGLPVEESSPYEGYQSATLNDPIHSSPAGPPYARAGSNNRRLRQDSSATKNARTPQSGEKRKHAYSIQDSLGSPQRKHRGHARRKTVDEVIADKERKEMENLVAYTRGGPDRSQTACNKQITKGDGGAGGPAYSDTTLGVGGHGEKVGNGFTDGDAHMSDRDYAALLEFVNCHGDK